jgi:hypothetical protein
MQLFAGGENPNKKGEFDPKGGKFFVEIMAPENVNNNLDLFAFFRCLSKHWHYISMMRKENRQGVKSDNIQKAIDHATETVKGLGEKKEILTQMVSDLAMEVGACQQEVNFFNTHNN